MQTILIIVLVLVCAFFYIRHLYRSFKDPEADCRECSGKCPKGGCH